MRKKIAVLLIVLMFCALAAIPASAAESEMIPVYAQVPDGWDAPCIWAWDDDGTGAFSSWPGGEMEAVGEDGWYYCYVPETMTNIIVNANGGTVQTDGISVDAGKSVWITVAADSTAEVSYDALTTAEIPAYVAKFTVHAYVPLSWETANIWAWSAPDGTNAFDAWPGRQLAEGEDGWFTGKVPVWVNSIIINGNGGSVQTADVSIEPKELWITVYEDNSYDLAYEDPETAGVPDVTVHAQVPADWAEPHAWAWSAPDGTNAFASWPGEAMTENGSWYDVTVPGWVNSFIVNGNGGTVQTSDLSVEPGREAWIVVTSADEAAVYYEEPSGEPAAPADDTPAVIATEPPASTEAPTPTEEPTAESGGLGTGAIVGIAAAVVAVGAGAGVAVSKKKKK